MNMRFVISTVVVLTIFGLALAGPLAQKPHNKQMKSQEKDHQQIVSKDLDKALSYAVMSKHESKPGDQEGEYHQNLLKHQMEAGASASDHHNGDHDRGHIKYEFKYGVKDPKTGDFKEQWEARDGDTVKGTYTLKEADGTTRIVEYTSDKNTGFEAIVHRIGYAHHDMTTYQKEQSVEDKYEEKVPKTEQNVKPIHELKNEPKSIKYEKNLKQESGEPKLKNHDKHGNDEDTGEQNPGHASSFIVIRQQ